MQGITDTNSSFLINQNLFIMKKVLFIMALAVMLVMGFSSCKKLNCQCVATGYASESDVQAVLDKHIQDCVEIAENGPITDQGIVVTCSYEGPQLFH